MVGIGIVGDGDGDENGYENGYENDKGDGNGDGFVALGLRAFG